MKTNMSAQRDSSDDPLRAPVVDARAARADAADTTSSSISVLLIPAPDQPETPVRMTLTGLQPSVTVGEIRQRSRAIIPSLPELGRLRLIYSGRLLARDDQTLEQLVGQETLNANKTIAIHLILRPLATGARQQPPAAPGISADANQPLHNLAQPHIAGVAHAHIVPTLHPVPAQDFPPRPSSTPAMAHVHGPYAAPAHPQGQPGFAPQGMPNPQQAQFIQQLQQQHLNMMQAMLRQTPGHAAHPLAPQPGPGQMNLPDFQRLYNQQAQARQAQQAAAASGRTTPQNGQPSGRAGLPPGIPMQADAQNNNDSSSQLPRPQHRLLNPSMGPGPGSTSRWQSGVHGPPSALSSSMFQNHQGLHSSLAHPEHETVYLLSSPSGHEAILLGPRSHHDYTASQSRSSSIGPAAPVVGAQPTPAIPPPNENDANRARGAAAGEPAQVQDLVALAMPLGGQIWLIVRLVGVVVLLTLNATWSRTFIVWAVAFIIYLAQTDVLNPLQRAAEQAWIPMRRHIEDLVRDAEDHGQTTQGDAITPEQAAGRILRRQRDQGLVRRIERSIALFVASFVPGVGEAQVAAREAAQRRRRDEAREREEAAQRALQDAPQEPSVAAPDASGPERPLAPSGSAEAAASAVTGGNAGDSQSLRHRQPHVEDVNEQET